MRWGESLRVSRSRAIFTENSCGFCSSFARNFTRSVREPNEAHPFPAWSTSNCYARSETHARDRPDAIPAARDTTSTTRSFQSTSCSCTVGSRTSGREPRERKNPGGPRPRGSQRVEVSVQARGLARAREGSRGGQVLGCGSGPPGSSCEPGGGCRLCLVMISAF